MNRPVTLGVITAASLLFLAGCGEQEASEVVESPSSRSSTAAVQLNLSNEAKLAASAKVKVVSALTGKLAAEAVIDLQGKVGASLDLDLPVGKNLISIDAFADAGASILLSSKSAMVDVAVAANLKLAVEICLNAELGVDVKIGPVGVGVDVGADVGVGAGVDVGAGVGVGAGVSVGAGAAVGAGTSVGAGASVTAGADLKVPVIGGVSVSVGLTKVKVDVNASVAGGGKLTFVWSGCGFKLPVVGSASAELSVAAVLAAALKTIDVVVQTEAGVAVLVKVKLDTKVNLLGVVSLAGTASTTVLGALGVSAGANVSVGLAACFELHAKATAACSASVSTAEVKAACLVKAAVELASCCGGYSN